MIEQVENEKIVIINQCEINIDVLKDLIQLTDNEINRQLIRKEQIETRSGFLVALWGITLGVTIDLFTGCEGCSYNENLIFIIFLGITCIFSLISLMWCIKGTTIYRYKFRDMRNYIICNGEYKTYEEYLLDKYEQLTDAWDKNELVVSRKYKSLTWGIILLSVYILTLLLMTVLLLGGS